MFDHRRVQMLDVACPECGPDRKSPINRVRQVRREWHRADGTITWNCARCGSKGLDAPDAARRVATPPVRLPRGPIRDDLQARRMMAQELWRRSVSAIGTVVPVYLQSRGICCDMPGTIRYLPAHGRYPHAMIAAFGFAEDTSCGRYEIAAEAVMGVHLTRLAPDGRGKLTNDSRPAKIMLGPSMGYPIMLFPPNDGLGLCVAEGIENALTANAASGLGAFAAGAANRLPRIADHVASYIDCVTIITDPEANGLGYAISLAEALTGRDLDVRMELAGFRSDEHGA